MWERSFVGVSVLLGASVESALALVPEGTADRELTARLTDARRPVRAQALAVVAQEVALALGEITLR